ncbi:MAG: calcium-binding protein, partial [Pseudomonadota bacterium]
MQEEKFIEYYNSEDDFSFADEREAFTNVLLSYIANVGAEVAGSATGKAIDNKLSVTSEVFAEGGGVGVISNTIFSFDIDYKDDGGFVFDHNISTSGAQATIVAATIDELAGLVSDAIQVRLGSNPLKALSLHGLVLDTVYATSKFIGGEITEAVGNFFLDENPFDIHFINSLGVKMGGVAVSGDFIGDLYLRSAQVFIDGHLARDGTLEELHKGNLLYYDQSFLGSISTPNSVRLYDLNVLEAVYDTMGVTVANVYGGLNRSYRDVAFHRTTATSDEDEELLLYLLDGTNTLTFSGVYETAYSTARGGETVIAGRYQDSDHRALVFTDSGTKVDATGASTGAYLVGRSSVTTEFNGSDGDDVMYGGSEGDRFWSSAGLDVYHGGGGNDFFAGGFDEDVFNGGAGRDTLSYWYSSEDLDFSISGSTIKVFNGPGAQDATANGVEVLVSGSGDDEFNIFGSSGISQINGGEGGDLYRLSGDFGRIDIDDSGAGNRLQISGTVLQGEAAFSDDGNITLQGFTLRPLSLSLLITDRNGNRVFIDRWADGDFGITLPPENDDEDDTPPDDDGNGGGDGSGDGNDGGNGSGGTGGPGSGNGIGSPLGEDPAFNDIADTFDQSTAPIVDPLVIDLEGNGLDLISRDEARVLFDVDADGDLELMGWVAPSDAFLVLDENGNGLIDDVTEMFGQPGQLGFAELAMLDDFSDPFDPVSVIDHRDSRFSELLIWQDLDSDGINDQGELTSLVEAGITQITLDVSPVGTWQAGNLVFEDAPYSRAGQADYGRIAEVFFAFSDLTPNELISEQSGPSDTFVTDMDSRGYGQLASWSRTAENNAAFAAQLTAFTDANLDNIPSVLAQIPDFLFEWADVTGLDAQSRGTAFDARKLVFLEFVLGRNFVDASGSANPDATAALLLEQAWVTALDLFSTRILLQGPLEEIFTGAVYDYSEDRVAVSLTIEDILTNIRSLEPEAAVSLLPIFSTVLPAIREDVALSEAEVQLEIALLFAELSDADFNLLEAQSAFADVTSEQITYPEDPYSSDGVFKQPIYSNNDIWGADASGRHWILGSEFGDEVYAPYRSSLLFEGGDADDRIFSNDPSEFTVFGAGGDDVIGPSFGTFVQVDDVYIRGGDGDDIIFTTSGRSADGDGGSGHRIFGDEGNDSLSLAGYSFSNNFGDTNYVLEDSLADGGSGDDTITISGQRNTALGGTGNDHLQVGYGNSRYLVLDGGLGDDLFSHDWREYFHLSSVFGGDGDDTVDGRFRNSFFDLGAGDDDVSLRSYSGNADAPGTTIDLGVGNDTLELGKQTHSNLRYYPVYEQITVDPGDGDDALLFRHRSVLQEEFVNVLSSGGADRHVIESKVRLVLSEVTGGSETFTLGDQAWLRLDLEGAQIANGGVHDQIARFGTGSLELNLIEGPSIIVEQAPERNFERLDIRLEEELFIVGPSVGANLSTSEAAFVFGFDGNDSISASTGDDEIDAGGGDDTVWGNNGDDILVGGAGNDTLNGGEGVDTADYSGEAAHGASSGINVELFAGRAVDGFGDTDTLVSIENIFGSMFDDAIEGDGQNNLLSGGSGSDILRGVDGNDTLAGGAGTDTL